MEVHVWRSFSSNNSSAYRLVARFESEEQAAAAKPELLAFIEAHAKEVDETENWDDPTAAQQALAKKHGYTLRRNAILSWGDEGLGGDEPELAVSGKTLVMYHSYCGGLQEGFGPYLQAVGAKVLEEEREAPEVAVFLTLPEGARGTKLREALDAYFAQRESGASLDEWRQAPWVSGGRHRVPYAEAEDVLYYCDGQRLGFQLPLELRGLDALTTYLKESGAPDYRLLLCDDELKQKLTVLSQTRRCPECNATSLRYLPAASERLEEDQLLCEGCGGMFTLASAARLRDSEKAVDAWLEKKGVQRVCPRCRGEELPLRAGEKPEDAELVCVGCGERVTLKALVAASPAQRLAGGGVLNVVHGAGKSVFVGDRGGTVYRSTNGGKAFKKAKVEGAPSQLFGLHAVSEQVVVVAGYGGLQRSEDGGETWRPVPCKATGYLFSFTRAADGTLWLAATGALWRSRDEGRSFTRVKVPFSGHMLHVAQASAKVFYAVGHQGTALRSEDGGKSWKELTSGVSRPLCRVLAFDEQEAVAVGDGGVIITTADGGARWTKRKSPTTADIEGLVRGNDGRLYAVTAGGELLISANRGKAWERQSSGASTHLWSLWPSPAGTLFLVGQGGLLVRRDDLDVPLSIAAPEKKAPEKKAPEKKPAAKQPAAKQPVAKKPAAKKPAAKKPAAKQPAAKQAAAKKPAAK